MKQYLNKLYFTLWWAFIALLIIFTQWWITHWREWLDLAWWVRLLYNMDFSQYRANYKNTAQFDQQRNNVVNIVKENIDGRISKLWVSDYSARHIVLWGKDYIQIDLWWIKNIEKAKKTIWKTVQMTFKVPFTWLVTKTIKNNRQLLAEKILSNIKSWKTDKIADYISDPRAWNIYTQQVSITWSDLTKVFWQNIEKALTWGYVYPELLTSKKSFDIYQFIGKNKNKYNFIRISILFAPHWMVAKENWELLNGERFKMATVSRSPGWQVAVNIFFDDKGRTLFWALTKKYLWQQMAIFVWNKLMTDPVIRAVIDGWVAQITWRYTPAAAQKLANNLNTWAMPVPLKLEQEEKVSPTLWHRAFRNAILAAWLWTLLIFIMFLIIYWFRYALVTLLSLTIFFVVLWWFIKLFWVVLSLSAIWAIILNIGMAVDANVIIFERIRENLKAGSSWLTSITEWYESSISAIRDGNLTTGLIAFLLFMIGTNIFKWFGTMMIVNIFIVLAIMLPSIPGLLILVNKNRK